MTETEYLLNKLSLYRSAHRKYRKLMKKDLLPKMRRAIDSQLIRLFRANESFEDIYLEECDILSILNDAENGCIVNPDEDGQYL